MDGTFGRPRSLPRQGLLTAIAIALVGGLATAGSALRVADSSADVHRSRFQGATDQAVAMIQTELDRYAAIGAATAATVQEFPKITPSRYESLLDDLVRDVDLDGLHGLSTTFLVPDDDLAAFAAREVQLQPAFDLRPADTSQHAIITRVWPADANQEALGFDAFANPDAAPALRGSIETDAAHLSDPLALQQAPDRLDGLVLYQPFRGENGRVDGWVGVVMQGQTLVDVVEDEFDLRLRITDAAGSGERVVGAIGGAIEDSPSDLRTSRRLEVFGQQWLLQAAPLTPVPSSGAGLVALGGVLATLAVGVLAVALADSQRRAVRLVDERTRDLRAANQALAGSNADLEVANDELARASSSKDDLLSVVSHELLTPLTVIRGFAQTLRAALSRGADAGLIDLAAERIDANAIRLEGVVENLLTAARMAAQGDKPTPAEVDVARIVAESVAAWMPTDVACEVRVEPGTTVHADSDHVRAILEQLLTNAVTYGLAPYAVEASVNGDVVHVAVCDAGDGIDPGDVDGMFDRFAQGSTGNTRTTRGVGLGLWIVREMALRNGGDVWYEADGGSRFVVSMPAGASTPTVHASAPRETPAPR